jgi:predicted TIM-barrel fold metal-dependent hydrolase
VIGDAARFPFAASRGYTPEGASLAEMRRMHRALHISRVVIVQPSFYGTDNSCTLDAVKQLGARARGVVSIGDETSNAALDEMQRGGVCGIICAGGSGKLDAEAVRSRFAAALPRVQGRKWHIEFHGRLAEIAAIREQVMASPVPVLFDHFGGAEPALGLDQPGFETLLSLVRGGKAYVDVSAPYRISKQAPDYPDVVPIARAIIGANPERVTWGTGWPHPAQEPGRGVAEITPLYQVDDGRNLNLLAAWTSGSAELKLALVDNPARLYGF